MSQRRFRDGLLASAAGAARFFAVLPLLALVAAAERWEKVPFSCRCGNVIGPSAMGQGAAWCDKCKQVCEPPLLKVPGWIAGVIVLLLVNLQMGT